MAATTQSYRDILANVAESLKPGGEIDTARMAEIDAGGKNLGAQLSGSAVSKGLGNVTMGIPTTVAKQVGSAKLKARSELMQSYLGVLTNLAGMAFQEEQAAISARNQVQQNDFNRQAQQMNTMNQQAAMDTVSLSEKWDARNQQSRGSQATSGPSAAGQPNLYAAGGYYGGNVSSAPNIYGVVGGPTAPASVAEYGPQTYKPSTYTLPSDYKYTY